MNKKSLLALLAALLLLVTGCAVKDENEKEVVRVGNVSYTMGDLLSVEAYLKDYYDYMGQLYTLYYGFNPLSYTDEDIRNEAVNSLAYQAVVLDKAAQLGLDQLTSEETAQLEENTAASWQEYRDSAEAELVMADDATQEQIDAAIDELLAKEGITLEMVRESEKDNIILEKAEAWATKDVTVTEDEFVAAFNEQVESEKTSYESDLSAYGDAVLYGDLTCYVPAGYRYVKQILIQYTDEDAELLNNISSARYTALSTQSSAKTTAQGLMAEDADLDALVAEVTVTLNEVTDPTSITVKESAAAFTTELSEEAAAAVKALAEANAIVAAYEEQEELAVQNALANIAPEADEVLSRLEAGEDWDALTAEFNDDPGMMAGEATAETGYPVCEGYASFDEAFVNAAMAIPEAGQWSDKIVGETYGYYIIKYMGDIPEGAVDMETVRETMTAELLATKQEEAFSTALDQWVAESNMMINYDLLGL